MFLVGRYMSTIRPANVANRPASRPQKWLTTTHPPTRNTTGKVTSLIRCIHVREPVRARITATSAV